MCPCHPSVREFSHILVGGLSSKTPRLTPYRSTSVAPPFRPLSGKMGHTGRTDALRLSSHFLLSTLFIILRRVNHPHVHRVAGAGSGGVSDRSRDCVDSGRLEDRLMVDHHDRFAFWPQKYV